MARDMRKTIEKGRAMIRKNVRLDMNSEELMALAEQIRTGNCSTDAMWTGLSEAYYLGLMAGYNAGKREAAKAAKKEG